MYVSIYSEVHQYFYRRINGQEGFVPASYVKEIEPTKVKKIIKKKETVTVPIKVTKKRIEKR